MATSTSVGLLILRVVVGVIFAAHGAQKAFGWWSGPGYAGWTAAIERMGFRPPALWALLSTAAEAGAGLLLVLGLLTPLAAAALIAQATVMVIAVHLPKGFWNKAGGIEFPVTLFAAAAALLASGPGSISIDAGLGIAYPGALRLALGVVAIAGALLAIGITRLRPATGPATSSVR